MDSARTKHATWLTVVALVIAVVPATSAGAASVGVIGEWTEPAAGYGFVTTAIDAARTSIDLSMYELDDPTIEAALVAREKAGVDVRVVLNSAYDGRSENAAAAAVLVRGGVEVTWAPSDQIFHAKYLVVDDRAAYVGTGNFTSYYYASTRDFWVEDTSASDVAAIVRVFNADDAGRPVSVSSNGSLVWSPGSTNALAGLIDSARHSLLVENEEMDSTAIEGALEGAARRGVDVVVVLTYDSQWSSALARLRAAGVHVTEAPTSGLYIHAKVICADCVGASGRVFVGSENFSVASLDYNRELGIITTAPRVVSAVEAAVRADATL